MRFDPAGLIGLPAALHLAMGDAPTLARDTRPIPVPLLPTECQVVPRTVAALLPLLPAPDALPTPTDGEVVTAEGQLPQGPHPDAATVAAITALQRGVAAAATRATGPPFGPATDDAIRYYYDRSDVAAVFGAVGTLTRTSEDPEVITMGLAFCNPE